VHQEIGFGCGAIRGAESGTKTGRDLGPARKGRKPTSVAISGRCGIARISRKIVSSYSSEDVGWLAELLMSFRVSHLWSLDEPDASATERRRGATRDLG
jgi:hypothetical protein